MEKLGTRRQALTSLATVGLSALVNSSPAYAQDAPIEIAGRPVEITLTPVSPQTVRITVQPLENGQRRFRSQRQQRANIAEHLRVQR